MTRYELWTMDNKRLVQWMENACYALANGKQGAAKDIDVAQGEILRRLAILDQINKEAENE